MQYIPNNLRALRIQKGMYQKDIAKYLSMRGMARVSRWESGLAYPDVANFMKLMELFQVNARDIYPPP